jgi:hypothetical protein
MGKGGQGNMEATNGNGKMEGKNGQMRKKGNKWEEKKEHEINNKNGKEGMKEENGKKKDVWDQTVVSVVEVHDNARKSDDVWRGRLSFVLFTDCV